MLLKKITVPLYRDYEVTSASRQFYIRSGYRPECSSFWQCVSSLFKSTNETANFWTSFLPGLYFTYLLMTSYRRTHSDCETGPLSGTDVRKSSAPYDVTDSIASYQTSQPSAPYE
uniref:Uncharacterized protein n=1 Tax=Timema cristinae TaxID=61476 RepID=A0A7R9CCS8_TIMCR|nr:unnamed protein product [Timema cristinae]